MIIKSIRFCLLYLLCSGILAGKVCAQTVADFEAETEFCTLSKFIITGLENNYGLRIVRNEELQAESNVTKANAGYLPTINATAGYSANLSSNNSTMRTDNSVTQQRNVFDHAFTAGLNLDWMLFDGFKIQANYQRLQELRRQSATQTRIAIEDYVADLTAEYYNFIQQRLRLNNLSNAVALSS